MTSDEKQKYEIAKELTSTAIQSGMISKSVDSENTQADSEKTGKNVAAFFNSVLNNMAVTSNSDRAPIRSL